MFRDKHRVKKIEFEIKQGIGESTKYEATANLCENENGNTEVGSLQISKDMEIERSGEMPQPREHINNK